MGFFETGDFSLEFENEKDQKEFEEVFQDWWHAWNTANMQSIVDQHENLIAFRNNSKDLLDLRKIDRNDQEKLIEGLFGLINSLELYPVSGTIRQIGNVVIAIGFFKENIEDKAGNKKETNGRFSFTYVKQNGKWQQIMAHRDAQFG